METITRKRLLLPSFRLVAFGLDFSRDTSLQIARAATAADLSLNIQKFEAISIKEVAHAARLINLRSLTLNGIEKLSTCHVERCIAYLSNLNRLKVSGCSICLANFKTSISSTSAHSTERIWICAHVLRCWMCRYAIVYNNTYHSCHQK